jgi:GT2 family glycosyltransferase
MTTAQASVIIPAWNGRAYLPQCLDALLAQEGAVLEAIVVDNASVDGSADLVAQRYPTVTLVRERSNLGFAGACNAGLRIATGEILVLLNQDTQVATGWLAALVDALGQARRGVVGCKISYPDGHTIQHAGGWIEWPRGLAHHYGQGDIDRGQWDTGREVDYVSGAALALYRRVMDQIGLLDEGFWPGYFEDADLCQRAREAGYTVWYEPSAVLLHEETASFSEAVSRSRAYHRGRLRFVLKHLSPRRFLAEFIPAEQAYLHALGDESAVELLRAAYLEAISAAAEIIPTEWREQGELYEEVLSALEGLYQPQGRGSVSIVPPLQEYRFRSSVPVVGPLIARIRSAWYGVAARWAVRNLMWQQEAINQQQEASVRSLVALARAVGRLRLDLDGTEHERRERRADR